MTRREKRLSTTLQEKIHTRLRLCKASKDSVKAELLHKLNESPYFDRILNSVVLDIEKAISNGSWKYYIYIDNRFINEFQNCGPILNFVFNRFRKIKDIDYKRFNKILDKNEIRFCVAELVGKELIRQGLTKAISASNPGRFSITSDLCVITIEL